MARPKVWNSKAEYQKAWWRAHPEKVKEYTERQKQKNPRRFSLWQKTNRVRHGRKYFLKKLYGITLEIYDEMLLKQNKVCAICSNGPTHRRKYLSVDHDHNTGEVRGLLCEPCNTGLGFFRDNPQLLDKAAEYARLRRYGAPQRKAGKKDAKDTDDSDVDDFPEYWQR